MIGGLYKIDYEGAKKGSFLTSPGGGLIAQHIPGDGESRDGLFRDDLMICMDETDTAGSFRYMLTKHGLRWVRFDYLRLIDST